MIDRATLDKLAAAYPEAAKDWPPEGPTLEDLLDLAFAHWPTGAEMILECVKPSPDVEATLDPDEEFWYFGSEDAFEPTCHEHGQTAREAVAAWLLAVAK